MLSPFAVSNYEVGAGYMYTLDQRFSKTRIIGSDGSQKYHCIKVCLLPMIQFYLFIYFSNQQVKEPTLSSRFYNAIFMRVLSSL